MPRTVFGDPERELTVLAKTTDAAVEARQAAAPGPEDQNPTP
ncbi:hypothetical protein [Kitasatospora sp. NPDC002965]